MPRREYQESLEDLRMDVQEMGELVLSRFDRSLYAFEHADTDVARAVIDGDEEVNQRYLDLESECIDLFALQQPVASDLRFIAASFKILTDLERTGDLAANLGRYTVAADHQYDTDIDVSDIGADAHTLVTDAVEAYVTEDAAACYEIVERDDEIDTLCHSASERVVRDLIERQAPGGEGTPWDVEQVMDDVSRLLLTIRDLERIADHGVNIAARTLYLVDSNPELIY
ncbi:phosphate signaling complex protein PhoU [Halorubrum sp. FL23]|uniref:phosphate signaling complex protein PhoU n=1 Tax=Halorubrum sp. FL23 TaxID=3458704 RepID=UPI0040335C2A